MCNPIRLVSLKFFSFISNNRNVKILVSKSNNKGDQIKK